MPRQSADEPDPVAAEGAQVHLVTAMVPGELRIRREPAPRIGQLRRRGERGPVTRPVLGQLPQPAEDVAAPVATGHPAGAADGQGDVPARGHELLGQLDTGLAGPDDEDAARRQVALAAVVSGVDGEHA